VLIAGEQVAQDFARLYCLRPPALVERNVAPALEAARRIPVGLARRGECNRS
jgi:hypothetical protein